MADIPTLTTDRLTLRPYSLSDFEAFAAMWGDPLVTRYIIGRAFSREESWSRLLRQMGHWTALGFGSWVVEETATGTFVGEIGFLDLHRDISPPLPSTEMGWVLARSAQGKGYATEGVRAALAHYPAFAPVCIIHPDNLPSLAVARKCGFEESCRIDYKDQTLVLLANRGL